MRHTHNEPEHGAKSADDQLLHVAEQQRDVAILMTEAERLGVATIERALNAADRRYIGMTECRACGGSGGGRAPCHCPVCGGSGYLSAHEQRGRDDFDSDAIPSRSHT